MITYFLVNQKWAAQSERILVPEHQVKSIAEVTDDGKTPYVRLALIGGGAYILNCSLETFIDSCKVEL